MLFDNRDTSTDWMKLKNPCDHTLTVRVGGKCPECLLRVNVPVKLSDREVAIRLGNRLVNKQ